MNPDPHQVTILQMDSCLYFSHSVQKPGGEGSASGGEAEFIPYKAKAGVSVGADGVFLEIHDNPPQALSDKFNSLILKELHSLLASLLRLKKAIDKDDNHS